MPVIEEKYDQNKIDCLKRYLKREADKGRIRDYEIIVDGFKVVSRTNNIEEFDDYEDELTDNARNISILIYDGAGTNRNTRYSFSLNKDGSIISSKPVNGIGSLGEIDEIIQQKLDEKDKEYKLTLLEQELAETKQQLKESEDWASKLQVKLEEAREEASNKLNMRNFNITELGTTILGNLFNQKLPQLAGLLGGIPAAPQAAPAIEPEVQGTFKKKEDAQAGPQLTEQQQRNLQNLERMEQAFNPEQLQLVIAIIQKLMSSPAHIIPVAQFLNLQNEQ